MSFLTIILIAIGLAMDAFAVSIVNGIAIKQQRMPHALKIAFSFGLFQAIMPVVGWLAGLSLKTYITAIDHWIAFILLAYIGIKMIYDAVKKDDSDEEACGTIDVTTLFALSIATSIDALAVGITFAFLKVSIIYPVLIIGIVTFILSLIGFFSGCKLGKIFGNRIEILGGCILIGIGTKILIEDLFF